MKTLNKAIIPSTAINPSFTSAAVYATQLTQVSLQVVTSGGVAPSFSVKLQASNDTNPAGPMDTDYAPTNWSDIATASVAVVANGTVLIPKIEICYEWIRAVVTYTSGTGTVVAQLHGV